LRGRKILNGQFPLRKGGRGIDEMTNNQKRQRQKTKRRNNKQKEQNKKPWKKKSYLSAQ
jgi:hypothetical protein